MGCFAYLRFQSTSVVIETRLNNNWMKKKKINIDNDNDHNSQCALAAAAVAVLSFFLSFSLISLAAFEFLFDSLLVLSAFIILNGNSITVKLELYGACVVCRGAR